MTPDLAPIVGLHMLFLLVYPLVFLLPLTYIARKLNW